MPGLLQMFFVSLLVLSHMPTVSTHHQPLYPTVTSHRLLFSFHLLQPSAPCSHVRGPVTTKPKAVAQVTISQDLDQPQSTQSLNISSTAHHSKHQFWWWNIQESNSRFRLLITLISHRPVSSTRDNPHLSFWSGNLMAANWTYVHYFIILTFHCNCWIITLRHRRSLLSKT